MKRLVKGVRIARSGIYEYRLSELQYMELTAPADNIKDVYKVYRPALILSENISKFNDLPLLFNPLTHMHPENYEDQNNFKKYGIGYTGSNADVLWEGDEISIISHVNIVDKEGFNAYNSGIIEVSPGYYGNFVWRKGQTEKGEEYDIVMIGIETVDHLIMTSKARGGHTCKILDSEGGIVMPKILSGLIWQLKKMFKIGIGDSEMPSFKTIVSDVMMNRNSLSEEDFAGKTGSLKNIIVDLPDTQDKGLLTRYIDEMPIYKQKADELAIKAGDAIVSLFEKLDKAALSDQPIAIVPVADAKDEGKSPEKDKEPEDKLEPIKKDKEDLEPIKNEEMEAIKPEGDASDKAPVYDKDTVAQEEQALNGATSQLGQKSPEILLNEVFGLLSQWKSGQSPTPPKQTADVGVSSVVKNTEYRSDNLEQKQTGSDRVLSLEEKKSPTGDAEVNTSVIIDDPTVDTAGKKGLIEIYNNF